MKVLILHQHFNIPQRGGSIRSYYLAKALVDKGIQVAVITGYNGKHYFKDDFEGIEVHYLPIRYNNNFGFTARITSFIKYTLAVIHKFKEIKDVDLCYAISVPLTVGLAAMWLKFKYKIRYIFEVGDLWPEAPIQMGVIKNHLLKQILYKLEKSIYNEATSIVALSPAIKDAIEKKVNQKKVHLIPNMADTDFYAPCKKQMVLEKKFGVEGKFVVSYMGALGLANGLDYFLECARASQRAALPIHFIVCGDGAMKENLKRSASRLDLLNLSFIPFQSRPGVYDIMNITDAVFVCYKSVPILETGSPNKYFDGLAAGKLIIINFGGWINEEIEKEKCGIQVDARQPNDFVKSITPFLSNLKLSEYSSAARALALRKYTRKDLSEKLVTIVLEEGNSIRTRF